MKKIYIIQNEYTNNLDYEEMAKGGIEFIAACGSLDAAIDYLRNYEDIFKSAAHIPVEDDDYEVIEFKEDGINSKFIFDTYECGIVTNCLFIEETELIGES